MTLATAITILGLVNVILAIVKEVPGATDIAGKLLAQIEPSVVKGTVLESHFNDLLARIDALAKVP